MVIGANGTGKSTILNAICLGLGGEPKLLGRADDVRDYVMNGKDEATIEIELAPLPGETADVLKRIIHRNVGSERGRGRGASTFYVNDVKVNIKAIQELVQGTYAIQIANLCTFLPQDKVGSFSGISSHDLLLETEKTLSTDGYFYKKHLELIQLEEDLHEGAGDVDAITLKLERYKHENEKLERDVKMMKAREEALHNVDLLEKKKLWLEFEVSRDKAFLLREKKAELKIKMQAIRQELAPLEQRELHFSELRKQAEAKCSRLNETAKHILKDMDKQEKKYEDHDDNIESLLVEIAELGSKRAKLEAEFNKAQQKVKSIEEQLKDAPDASTVEKELMEAKEKRKEAMQAYDKYKRRLQGLDKKLSDITDSAAQLQRKVTSMEDDQSQRKERIFRQHASLGKVFAWLDNNRDRFRRPVSGPIVCEIAPFTVQYASYIEQHVPNHVLKSFVVETKEDYDLLYKVARQELKLPVNILMVHNGLLQPLSNRFYSDQKMDTLKKQHGVISYLDETFTAPDAILQALRDSAAVHRVLVGGATTTRSMDDKNLKSFLAEPDSALGQTNFQTFSIFTLADAPSNRQSGSNAGTKPLKYTGVISAYDKVDPLRMRTDYVGDAKMLAPGVDEERKNQAKSALAAAHDEARQLGPQKEEALKAKNKAEKVSQNCAAASEAAKMRMEEINKIQSRYTIAKAKCNDAEAALNEDATSEKKKLADILINRVVNSMSALQAHAKQQEKLMQTTTVIAGISANKAIFSAAERTAR
jgi:chromosome segregation ATPase